MPGASLIAIMFAYPGGLALARVLADVTALVAGGYRRILLGGARRAA